MYVTQFCLQFFTMKLFSHSRAFWEQVFSLSFSLTEIRERQTPLWTWRALEISGWVRVCSRTPLWSGEPRVHGRTSVTDNTGVKDQTDRWSRKQQALSLFLTVFLISYSHETHEHSLLTPDYPSGEGQSKWTRFLLTFKLRKRNLRAIISALQLSFHNIK